MAVAGPGIPSLPDTFSACQTWFPQGLGHSSVTEYQPFPEGVTAAAQTHQLSIGVATANSGCFFIF